MSQFHPLTVKHIKKLTPTSVAVTFSIPKELAQTFTFTAGQYITIKKEIKGKELKEHTPLVHLRTRMVSPLELKK